MDIRKRIKPLSAVNNLFIGKEPWQIVAITAGSVVTVYWIRGLLNGRESLTERFRKEFFRWLRKIPMVRKKIDEKLSEIRSELRKDVAKRLRGCTCRTHLPQDGLTKEEVFKELKQLQAIGRFDIDGGYLSGAVYHNSMDIIDVASEAYSLTAYTNPLHADVFPGINKMEAEIVKISASLFNGDSECCGCVTTGGTESIIMACKAFRDRAYSMGIKDPQIIVPTTGHSAFDKAAQYLGLTVVSVPVDPVTYTVDLKAVEKAIGRRTCLIVGSAPNFPYGTMDDIVALSSIAVRYRIALHVDGCLGGFLTVFMSDAGYDIPLCDFRLPGVCSISADTHKYGYSPKGTSVLLYRKSEYMHYQYTVTTDWPGGVYGSPSVNGSRAGGSIAACWATLMFIGRNKYVEMTRQIMQTAKYIERKLREIDGLFVFGKPMTSVVAIGSDVFDIFRLADKLHTKGWSLNVLQFPSGIHFCVTSVHTKNGIADKFIKDVKTFVGEIMQEPGEPLQGKMAIYGVAQTISDRSLVGDITKQVLDTFYYLPTEGDYENITKEDKEVRI